MTRSGGVRGFAFRAADSTQRNWWLPIAVVAAITFALGYIGFRAADVGRSLADDAYLSMQLFVLESGAVPDPVPWQLEIARIVAPVIAAFVTVGLIREVISALRSQEWFFGPKGGHVIVCGLGRKGARLALAYAEQGEHVVAVEPHKANAERAEELRRAGVHILEGSAADKGALRRAGIASAQRMIVTCGADRIDAQVTALAHELLSGEHAGRDRARPPLKLFVHLVDRELKQRLVPLLDRQAEHLDVTVFNVYEAAAEALAKRAPFAGEDGICTARRVALIGFGELGESLVVALSRAWSREKSGPAGAARDEPGFVIVDENPEEKWEALESRYRWLGKIQRQLEKLEIDGPEFERGEVLRQACDSLDAVVVCLSDEVLSVVTALTVSDILDQQGRGDVPVLMRVESAREGLPALMAAENTPADRNVLPVSVLDQACTPASLDVFATRSQGPEFGREPAPSDA